MELEGDMTRSQDLSTERCFDLEQQCYPTRKLGCSSAMISTTKRGFRMKRSKEEKHESSYFFIDNKRKMKVLDPRGPFLQLWNKFFALSCIAVLSLDPLFFYIPIADNNRKCLDLDSKLKIIVCVLRSLADLCYMFHILLQFGTGYRAPCSKAFKEDKLIEDLWAIAKRYVCSYFFIDILSALPLPQVVILIIAPTVNGLFTRRLLMIVIFLQYIPRLFLIISLYKQRTEDSRIFPDTPWAGAAFNLFLYMLASNIIGAFWYLFTIERVDTCWRKSCADHDCDYETLYCGAPHEGINLFLNSSCLFLEPNELKKQPADFNFGIFLEALQADVVEKQMFWQKFFYCFWWGLRNLSSMGQNLSTSNFVWENLFAIFISVTGLILFALLIGNMQKYLQSISERLGEMKAKRRDRRKIDQWMSQRKLPESLRRRIRRHEQFKWQGTRGIREDDLMKNLPKDLRRDVNSHIRMELLLRVPLFADMGDSLVEILCDHLTPALYTEGSLIYREGDPVDEMLFLVRGTLDCMTTNDERTGLSNYSYLQAGDFCGEELLTWALNSKSCPNLPTSKGTIRVSKDVEAFALKADHLKLVASQCMRLHGKQIQRTFRFYSQQWRTWAACYIQEAWHRYIRRKRENSLRREEDRLQAILAGGTQPLSSLCIQVS